MKGDNNLMGSIAPQYRIPLVLKTWHVRDDTIYIDKLDRVGGTRGGKLRKCSIATF
jgi:hypothetical protein